MEFLNPASLWLLLLGLVPLALYLFRRRSRTVRVSTLVFFKTLAKEHQDSAWLRRLKKLLSFLLTVLMLVLAVFILARLIVSQDRVDRHRSIVILLDRSASMALADASGETRLEAAKRLLVERLKHVPEEVGLSLVVYDSRPEVLQPRTFKRRELLSRLDSVETRPIAGRPDAAFELAGMLAGLEPPTLVWHLSDRRFREASSPSGAGDGEERAAPAALPFELRELDLALPEVANASITAVRLRPVPLEHARYDVFAEVFLNRDAPAAQQLKLLASVGGIPSQVREIDLEPGERSAVTIRINGSRDQILRLELEAERDDFPADNQVNLPLPEIRPIVAAWIRPDDTEDPYTRLALASIQESGSFQLLKGSPAAWPLSEEVDAVIFDGWLPSEWPAGLPAVVINPPGPSGPVAVRRLDPPLPHDGVRVGSGDHPVLFRVSSGRVALTQTSTVETRGALEPLWWAGSDAVLAAGEVGGSRLVVMGFSPGLSERLPLTASFPLLMGNALFWCVDREEESTSSNLFATGDLARVSGGSLTWLGGGGGRRAQERIVLSSEVVEMDRIGIWEGGDGTRGSAHLLSAVESDLRAHPPEGTSSDDDDYFSVKGGLSGSLKVWLLGALLAVVLAESWLFHRHAVY